MQTTAAFNMALESFVEHLQNLFDKAYSNPQIISIDNNAKYIRVAQAYKTNPDGRSVYCFIDSNGEIWKPASWKGPAKNFSRGNIFSSDSYSGIGPWGI